MPERTFTYRFETEDGSSGPLDLMERKVSSLEAGFRQLVKVEDELRTRRQSAIQLDLAHAEAMEELAQAGIQTTGALEAQIQKYDRLLDFVKEDTIATQQLTNRKRLLEQQLRSSKGATDQFSAASGQAAAFVNNFGFTLNDAQQFQFGFDQGLRAISNNIGVLIGQFQSVVTEQKGVGYAFKLLKGQLVGGLGLSLAFNAVSTAAILLQDTFKSTAKASEETANKLEDQFSGLVKIIDAVSGTFEFNFVEAEKRQKELGDEISNTSEELEKQEKIVKGLQSAVAFNANLVNDLRAARERLTTLNDKQLDQEKELAAINSRLKDEQQIREDIAFLEERGFKFNREKTEEQRRQEEAVKAEREEQEKLAEAQRKNRSELEELIEKRKSLVKLLDDENAGQFRQVVLVEREIQKLEELAEKRRQAIRDQAVRDEFGDDVNLDFTLDAQGLDDLPVKRFEELTKAIEASKLAPRGLSDAILQEVMAGKQAFDEIDASTARLIAFNENLASSVQSTLGNAIGSFGEAIGEFAGGVGFFESIGKSLALSLAELAGVVGRQMIGFGLAGIALKKLITNPVAAVIAGTALVALSRLAKSRIQRSINSTTSGGSPSFSGVSGGTGAGSSFAEAIPRNTREEQIQRQRELEEIEESRRRRERQAAEQRHQGFLLEQERQRQEMQAASSIASGRLVSSPLLTTPATQEVQVAIAPGSTLVLPNGDLLFAIRSGLENEAELGGSGSLEG